MWLNDVTENGRGEAKTEATRNWDVEHNEAHSEAAAFYGRTVLPVTTDRLRVVLSAGERQWLLRNHGGRTQVKDIHIHIYTTRDNWAHRLLASLYSSAIKLKCVKDI